MKAVDCTICGARKTMRVSRKLVFDTHGIRLEKLAGKRCSVCKGGYLGPAAQHKVNEAVYAYFREQKV